MLLISFCVYRFPAISVSSFYLFSLSFCLYSQRVVPLVLFHFPPYVVFFISCACVARSPSLSFFLSGYLCESSAPFLQSHLRIQVRLCFTSAFVYMSLCAMSNEIVCSMCKVCCIINCILDAFSAHSLTQNALLLSSVSEFKRMGCHRLLCGRLASREREKSTF